MNKFQKASKRIAAVAVSAALISATATAAGLSTYPTNFVKSGAFTGDIVIGSTAAVSDSTAAASIISDLKNEFSGNADKVKITYKSQDSASSGQTFKIANPSASLNYGETLGNVRTQDITRNDVNILKDGTFTNGFANQDYTQKVRFNSTTGIFSHSLKTNAGETLISDNVYVKSNTPFMTYELNMNTPVDFSSATTSDQLNNKLVGKSINILGSDYTITSFITSTGTGTGTISTLDLIGGTNTLSLGEGETSTINVEGVDYEVSIKSVALGSASTPQKVLLSVNGVSDSISLYDTVEVGGISVAVTDLVPSSRDSIKGYAQIVLGGQKITLKDNQEIKINDRYVSDISPKYYAKSTFRATSAGLFDGFNLDFEANDDMVIKAGQSFNEPVFNLLSVKFDGLNVQDSDYTTAKLTTSGERVDLDGVLIDGRNNYNQAIAVSNATTSDYNIINSSNDVFGLPGKDDVYNGDKLFVTDALALALPLSTIKGERFLTGDKDTQYLWEVVNFDSVRNETNFKDTFTGTTNNNVKTVEWVSTLDGNLNAIDGGAMDLNVTGTFDSLALGNQRMMNLTGITSTTGTSNVTFSLDTADTNVDSSNQDNESISVSFYDATNGDNSAKIKFVPNGGVIVPTVGRSDISQSNSDIKEYVTVFGTKIKYDSRNNNNFEIMTPSKQVEATVNLVIGGVAATTSTVTVDATEVDAKKQELIDAGNVIVGTPETITATTTKFDITAPSLDKDVTGTSDMIVVGGPAVNTVAAELLGLSGLTTDATKYGVSENEAVIRFFNSVNSVLVYGYSAENTVAAASKLNKGGLTGDSVNVAN